MAGTDDVVSFKVGGTGNHTLIADGDYSAGDGTGATAARNAFDAGHNHYGEKDEAPGEYFSDDDGFYTGPDH